MKRRLDLSKTHDSDVKKSLNPLQSVSVEKVKERILALKDKEQIDPREVFAIVAYINDLEPSDARRELEALWDKVTLEIEAEK